MIPAIICDIDGTLAIRPEGYSPYDPTHYPLDTINKPIERILLSVQLTHQILIVSGRSDLYEDVTVQWLLDHDLPFAELWMRPRADDRNDTLVKRDIYDWNIKDVYDVLFVLDDRDRVVNMWRNELGLTCLQVAEGDF